MTKRKYFSSNDNRISIEYRNEHRESIEECDFESLFSRRVKYWMHARHNKSKERKKTIVIETICDGNWVLLRNGFVCVFDR